MITLLMFAALISVAAYFATFKLSSRWRLVTAASTFFLAGIFPLAYVLIIGDQPPPGSRPVTQEELERAADSAP